MRSTRSTKPTQRYEIRESAYGWTIFDTMARGSWRQNGTYVPEVAIVAGPFKEKSLAERERNTFEALAQALGMGPR